MATRNSNSRTNNKRKSTTSKKSSGRRTHKKKKSGAGILILIVILALVGAGIYVSMQVKELYKEEIFDGVVVDGIDLSGMTEAAAKTAVDTQAQDKLENISIVFRYNNKTWKFNAEDLQAHIKTDTSLQQAFEAGKTGNVIDRYKAYNQIKSEGLTIKSKFEVDRQVLVDALADVKKEIDQPMMEPTIEFDPTGIGYDQFVDPEFDEVAAMFTIVPGKVGYAMDYDKALQDLNDQLSDGWSADIALTVVESHPTKTVEELQEYTTLVYHASSPISNSNRKIPERNHNIEKAIGFYKGLVVQPGEIVSYNDILGERTEESGWLPAPTIARDKSVVDEIGGGICQAASTIFNAAFRSGTKLLENNPHSWRAYYDPFGYAMDAMINYGTSDMIFQNDSEYPIFINTYLWVSPTNGLPGYVDVDIYTMPQKDENGNILHIMPEATEVRTEPAPPMIYEEIDAATAAEKFPDANWVLDPALNKMTYLHISPRVLYEYKVDRVWYKDCEEVEKGVWEPGVEVKREYSHNYIYKNVAGLTYTMPAPTPAPTAAPTPAPAPTDASG